MTYYNAASSCDLNRCFALLVAAGVNDVINWFFSKCPEIYFYVKSDPTCVGYLTSWLSLIQYYAVPGMGDSEGGF